MAELLQHLLTVGQIWSHELGGIHLDLLPHLPRGQARLGEDRKQPHYLTTHFRCYRDLHYRNQVQHLFKCEPLPTQVHSEIKTQSLSQYSHFNWQRKEKDFEEILYRIYMFAVIFYTLTSVDDAKMYSKGKWII